MKARIFPKYVGIYISTKLIQTDILVTDIYSPTYKAASQHTGLDGIVVLLDGYDAS